MPRWEKEKSKERDGARRNLPLLFSFAITFEIKPKLRKGSVFLPPAVQADHTHSLWPKPGTGCVPALSLREPPTAGEETDSWYRHMQLITHMPWKPLNSCFLWTKRNTSSGPGTLWCPLLSAWFHDWWSRNPLDPKLQVPQRDSWTLVAFTWLSFSVCWAPHATQAPEDGLWDPTTNIQRSAVFLYTVNKQSI